MDTNNYSVTGTVGEFEYQETASGAHLMKITVLSSAPTRDGERVNEVTIVVWNRSDLVDSLAVGQRIAITDAMIQTSRWQGRDGVERVSMEVVARQSSITLGVVPAKPKAKSTKAKATKVTA